MASKKKKNKIIVNEREIELLNKYYEVDNKKRITTMPLHYDKASDLINNKIISKDNYLFDYEELSNINQMIKRIPIMYKININFQIDDYEDYEPEKLMSGFNDALELNQYNLFREKRYKFFKAGILLAIGILVLFIAVFAKLNNWFSNQEQTVAYEVFDIIGWVFIWEMVTVAFLTPSELLVNSTIFKLRVLDVKFLDSENNIVIEESLKDLSKKWRTERKIEFFSKWALLISGISFLVMGSLNIVVNFSNIPFYLEGIEKESQAYIVIIVILLDFLVSILEILGGIAALFRYNGRISLTKISVVFSILISLLSIVLFYAYVSDISKAFQAFAPLLISILYISGLITNQHIYKIRNKDYE